MIQFAPQLILISYTIVRITIGCIRISYDRQNDTSTKVGHVIGTFLYYFICHWVLWAGGFYDVFER
ncbi:hypothetical protein [Runella slithyformis]|uniref:Uncharacterized protein n=1 Tax=Runella slithyformis (strain ATCC 29530 / DSM 19594 / LMG 11500 / NCIMB 11436 / LSU 4) TaxID=761193 RepID=A0A7U4E414_RUNSL|nr:hypothetical protein [Runella slithyformis]AEI46794.1 hypothetical protein Runsl_0342 [Runella slithyformis DSM 19594]